MDSKLFSFIESYYDEIRTLSIDIHSHPEVSFKEVYAANLLTSILERYGFEIQKGVGSLETAFIATYKTEHKYAKTVAFLAEYDALNQIGHACGHNLISAISIYSAIILSQLHPSINIKVIGCPAEEKGGGKIILLNENAFQDIDYALMVHPDNKNQIGRLSVGVCDVFVEYHGKGAHSSEPEKGINALQAIISTFNGIDAIRTNLPYKANVSGIIHEGGVAANIIPHYASATFCVRGANVDDIEKIIHMLKNIVKGIEIQLGVKGNVKHGTPYANRIPNLTMEHIFKKHLERLEETVEIFDVNKKSGASDIGNVMKVIPAIHPYIKICDDLIGEHTEEFKEAAKSDYAHKQALKAIYALVQTVLEISCFPSLDQEIMNEFNKING